VVNRTSGCRCVATVVFALLAIVSSSITTAQKISVWLPPAYSAESPSAQVLRQFADEFVASHPGREIEFVTADEEALLVAIAANVPPNGLIHTPGPILKLIETGVAVPLDDLDREIDQIKVDLFTALLEEYSRQGKLYAMPILLNTVILIKNGAIFQQTGLPMMPIRTWEDVRSMARRMTQDLNGDGQNDRWGLPVQINPSEIWEIQYLQHGGTWLDASMRPDIDNEAGMAATQFYIDAVHVDRFSPIVNTRGNSRTMFMNNQAGMWVQPSGVGAFTGGEACNCAFETQGLPVADRPANITTGVRAVVLDTPLARETWEFLKYATSPRNLARFSVANNGTMVARRSSYETDEWMAQASQSPWLRPDALPAELSNIVGRPSFVGIYEGEINRTIREMLRAVLEGTLSPDAGLIQAEQAIGALLER